MLRPFNLEKTLKSVISPERAEPNLTTCCATLLYSTSFAVIATLSPVFAKRDVRFFYSA